MPFRKPLTKEKISRYIKEIQPFKQAFDLINEHVVITDENANIIYGNQAAEKNTGFKAAEMIGKNPGDLWGGQMPKDFYEAMWRKIKMDKEPFVGEVRNRRKDGTEYWQEVHISPIINGQGEAKFFIGIETNITRRKEKEKTIEEVIEIIKSKLPESLIAMSGEKVYRRPISVSKLEHYLNEVQPLKKSFDLLDDHVLITDDNANILYANKAAERNTGFSIEEMLGKNPGDLWGGNMPNEFYEAMWRKIKTEKQPFVGEVRNRRKDGTEYWQEIHISPVLDEAGEVKFFIAIEPNITDQKEKQRFKEDFISVLGHQLRSPLAATKWALEILRERGKMGGDEQRLLEEVYRKNKELIVLIEDLLVLSRVGAVELTKEAIDLPVEIEKIIEATKKEFPKTSFSFKKTGARFPLIANKSLTLQLFSNIISNAAKYSAEEKGTVAIILKQGEAVYDFSCENNGAVIKEEDQPKIFSKFYRSTEEDRYKRKSIGLGLYIVKLVADTFGWSVTFQSPAKNSEGTIFYVKVPVR